MSVLVLYRISERYISGDWRDDSETSRYEIRYKVIDRSNEEEDRKFGEWCCNMYEGQDYSYEVSIKPMAVFGDYSNEENCMSVIDENEIHLAREAMNKFADEMQAKKSLEAL